MDAHHVFISYKVEDFDQALAVKKHLEENGIVCWMAPMSIRGGRSYAQEIPQAIRESGAFVLILTQKAQESKWVPREVDQAINCEKVIFPYFLDNCPLRDDFSFYLTNVQHYEAFRDPEESLARMTRDIQKTLGITPPVKEKIEPEIVESAEIPETVETPESVSKPKLPKKEKKSVEKTKKPADKAKKRNLALILGGALLAVAVIVALLLPRKISISGTKLDANGYSARLENVTLTQRDVDKFSKFKSLGVIHLNNCNIEAKDLSPMITEKLYLLDLTGCGITDAQFATLDFSAASRFDELYIGGNPELTNLANLEVCADEITVLNISDTGIRDFDWLRAFTNLRIFYADRIGLQDTAVLDAMVYLEGLSLSGNGIQSLDGLKNTSKLSEVDLSDNILTDVSVLSRSAACLEKLDLGHNGLTDLRCLSDAKGLLEVIVDDNKLTDLDWLNGGEGLCLVSASGNQISSLSGLNLNSRYHCYLNLSDNKLQTIETGDLVFNEEAYLILDFSGNDLTNIALPQNCKYYHLALLDNPQLDLSSLSGLNGTYLFFDFPAQVPLQTLQDLAFSNISIVGCPLDRQVEIEEGLSGEHLVTREEALEMIAKEAAKYVN